MSYWDRFDFDEFWIDPPYYDEVFDPTPERSLATEICRRIPRGWWSSYGDLGKAYRLVVMREKLDYRMIRDGHQLGTDPTYGVDDARRFHREPHGEWSVPWHRMRDKNGFCRSPRQPGKVIYSNADEGNVRFVRENPTLLRGGLTLVGGQASPARRVDMCEAIRRGYVELVFTS